MKKKLCFLFLIQSCIHNEEIWNLFFKLIHKDFYDIIIHHKPDCKLKYFNKYKLNHKCITTSWGDKSLVEAVNIMLKKGYSDKNNSHFILVSDSDIPLKNFEYIYNFLQNDFSYFSYQTEYIKKNHYLNNFFHNNIYKKSSQWCILNRKHTNIILNHSNFISLFSEIKYPDERVYINTLYKNNLLDEVKNIKTTFCDWSTKGSHPKTFYYIHEKFLINLINGDYLFGRKFKNKKIITKR